MNRLNECRTKLCKLFPNNTTTATAILINTNKQLLEEHVYYQDPNFFYLFGDPGPNCWGGMIINNDNCCKCTLFVDNDYLSKHYQAAYGDRRREWMKNCDCVVRPQREIPRWIKENGIRILYQLASTPPVPGLELSHTSLQYNRTLLPKLLSKARVIKTPSELQILRKINKISSDAHNEIKKQIDNKQIKRENEIECLFNYLVHKETGNRLMAYPCICASGPRACIIHYMKNNNPLIHDQMILMDMGGKLDGYIADITQTVCVSRDVSPLQRLVYNIVLKTHDYILSQLKAGVNWNNMEVLCRRLLLQGLMPLLDLNEVKKDGPDQVMHEIMPHWLGHNIGLQVHDVGNLYKECKILQTGMTLAVEPAVYVSPSSVKYFKPEIKKYFGVRIESNVIIHESFAENMTTVTRKI